MEEEEVRGRKDLAIVLLNMGIDWNQKMKNQLVDGMKGMNPIEK